MKKEEKSKKRKKRIVSRDHAWEFHECQNLKALVSPKTAGVVLKMVVDSGFTLVGELFCPFSEFSEEECGFTLIVCIGESRIDLHGWPEEGCLHVGINYCDFTQDNSEKKDRLIKAMIEFFKPGTIVEKRVRLLYINKKYTRRSPRHN